MTEFNSKMFVKGQQVKFTYNDKAREGTVEAVKETHLVVEFNEDGKKVFKSFNYEKMV